MTQPYEGRYGIKPSRFEGATLSSMRSALTEVIRRIESEEPQARFVRWADRVEPEDRGAGERTVDNRRINREDRGEMYLDLDPMGSNCPARFPAPDCS
jgi:hypothetical protein